MATITKGKTFINGELVTPATIHQLVDAATISGIVNADISASAAIADTKLAQISTANKVAQSAVTNLTTDLAGKAPTSHTHTIANVTNLQTALDGKQASGSYAPSTGIAQSAVTNLTTDLAGKAPTSHTHGNITNAGAIGATANLPVVTTASGVLTTVAAGTAGQVLTSNGGSSAPSFQTLAATSTSANNLTGGSAGTVPYQSAAGTTAMLAAGTSGQVFRSNGTAAPSWLTLGNSAALNTGTVAGTVATGDHTHTIANVTGLQTALDGKQAAGNYATTAHNHLASEITTGTLAIGRIPTGTTSTTVALGNHTHDAAAITSGTIDNARTTATSANTANAIVARDVQGQINVYSVVADNFETSSAYFSRKSGIIDMSTNSVARNELHINVGANASEVFGAVAGSSKDGTLVAVFKRHTLDSFTGATIGSITATGTSTTVTGVAYNTTSDYRLKTNLEPLTEAVARLLQIPVHRFNWLDDPNAPKVDGFLAHEAQAVVPEAVTGTKDEVDAEGNPVHQGIDQSKLVPLLVAAVQELAARVAALEAR